MLREKLILELDFGEFFWFEYTNRMREMCKETFLKGEMYKESFGVELHIQD